MSGKRVRRALILVCAVAVVPAAAASAAVTEYPVPTANSGPLDIVAGPDGALWFTEILGGKIGRSETDGTITEFPLPNAGSWPTEITAGPDGALWFVENRGGKIGRISTSGDVTEYPLSPSGDWEPGIATSAANDITVGPDGALWFTQFHRVHGETSIPATIGRITTDGAITYFPLDSPYPPYYITAGPDGALWFTRSGGLDEITGQPLPDKIGRITTAGAITEFPVPEPLLSATGIAAGPDGALWFTDFHGNRIGRVATDGSFTSFPITCCSAGATSIIQGPDGAMWFTNSSGGTGIGRITMDGTVLHQDVPSGGHTNGITTGPDGRIWFTEPSPNKIGRRDMPPTPSATIGDVNVIEGDAAAFEVHLSNESDDAVSFDYATSDGTATSPADYQSASGTVTIGPGDSTGHVIVPVVDDGLAEAEEGFTVTLSDPQEATIADATATATISDAPDPAISIADSPARSEGGNAHSFAVTLSAPSHQVSVDYATSDGTAVAPGDYATKTGTVTFAPGQTTRTVTVSSAGDTLDENDETFSVGLDDPVGATIADGSGSGTILDNDVAPTVAITDSPARGEGGAPLRFDLTLSAPSGRAVTVDFTTRDGTAKSPGDYHSGHGSITFPPGQTTARLTLLALEDALDEANETFSIRLSAPVAATISDPIGDGVIVDNDPTPSLSIVNAANRVEGGAVHRFVVRLSAASGRTVSVDYMTLRGTAVPSRDFVGRNGTLNFAAGQTSKTVDVQNINDTANEPNETFSVRLSQPLAATIADNVGTTTIVDND